MDKLVLPLETRTETGKNNRQLRASGKVPAVVYGRGGEPEVVMADSRSIEKIYAQAGGNKIVGVKIDDARQKNVLFHEVQLDGRSGKLIHADFYLVRMDEKIKTEVPLHFTGESTAVYQQEGTLVRAMEAVEIEALPGDLPESFEVDIAVLDDFEKTITVADLKMPEGVELLSAPEDLIARVEPPRSDEELAELDEEVKEELPEGVAEEDQQVSEDDPESTKEPQGKAAGADPTASK